MNAFDNRHVYYPVIFLNGISVDLSISIQKQLSWAIKKRYDRAKFDSSSYLK